MNALIIAAHGSRREASNEEIRQLAAALRSQGGDRFDLIAHAFLEIAEPSIPDAIGVAVEAGAQDVVVLPYFLSAGRHVASDIPDEIALAQRRHPGVRMRVTPYLGSAPEIAELVLSLTGVSDRT